MIGHIWAADRAQENRVRFCKTVERVVVHHRAGTDVVIAAPQVLRPLDAEARQRCERIEHDARRGNRLDTDTIARDQGDAMGAYHQGLVFRGPDNDDRAGCVARHLLAHRTEQQASKTAMATTTDD